MITGVAAKCHKVELFVETEVHDINCSQDNIDFTKDQPRDSNIFAFCYDIVNLGTNSYVLCICHPVNIIRPNTVYYYRNI